MPPDKNNPVDKVKACKALGWEIEKNHVWAYGQKFPLTEPVFIHLKVYRTHESHETRLEAMKQAFFTLWPQHADSYNYWMERMFREHCDHNTEIFSVAGGAGIGKTFTGAYIAALFWLALPHKRTVIVTSTTLESLKARIYGYVLRALKEMAIPYPITIRNSAPPSITTVPPDFIHGIYGIAAVRGNDEDTIKNIIGRHPEDSILIIMDEAPDMPVAILSALPNLKKGLQDRFQAIVIGNSNEITDLHGAVSTPKIGWPDIDPAKDFRWETNQPNGVCLYFNPYDSPAIHEPDSKKRKILSRFLITNEKLREAERNEGTDSIAFWRFTMGFWKFRSLTTTIVTEDFLKDYDPTNIAEFSGRYPLITVAGLDAAFSTGGDKCILRLATLGQHVNGNIILDYHKENFIFIIKIQANTGKSAEIQIADQVLDILKQYSIPVNTLCVDASGQGRGLADIIQLKSGGYLTPTKIFSTNFSYRERHKFDKKNSSSPDLVISSGHEMWFKGREFISQKQIYGLDALAYGQLHTRLVLKKATSVYTLESKTDYKRRMAVVSSLLGRSPDEADAAMLALQAAIIHHGFFPGQTRPLEHFDTQHHREFATALAAFTHHNPAPSSKPFTLNANYKNGIDSILAKRMF